MITTRKAMIITLALAALLASVPFVAAQSSGIEYQHANGVVSLTTDTIGVKVSAYNQVPHFHFWDENDTTPGADYHVLFSNIFEANDTNDNGVYDAGVDHRYGDPYTLPATDWDFSGFITEQDGDVITAVHFNFTNSETYAPPVTTVLADMPISMNLEIEIRVHINLTNSNQMKFDFSLEGWEWMYEDSLLVFQFTVAESEHGQNAGTSEPADFNQDSEGYRFEFGDAYMECAKYAFTGNGTHQVQMKASHGNTEQNQESKSVYLAFEYFGNETLDYDPTLGVLSTAANPLDITTMLLVGGSAAAVIVVAALIVKMRG
ncbi:MAG: hypothetical protein AM324_007775 [Candidatus Thorarchaeota archaeon SMTZ1-83]|nr:MAG: hypothetical protein AM324_09100 [Candidatus Thorarchaeota archaeon SMTZ1-83]